MSHLLLKIHGAARIFVSIMYCREVQADIQQNGKSSQYFRETTFQTFEGLFNLWPGFQPRSPTPATSASD